MGKRKRAARPVEERELIKQAGPAFKKVPKAKDKSADTIELPLPEDVAALIEIPDPAPTGAQSLEVIIQVGRPLARADHFTLRRRCEIQKGMDPG